MKHMIDQVRGRHEKGFAGQACRIDRNLRVGRACAGRIDGGIKGNIGSEVICLPGILTIEIYLQKDCLEDFNY
jgi:hypothetical protein